jgi:hypothetical protein
MAATFYNLLVSAAHSGLTMASPVSADVSDNVNWAVSRAGGYTTAAVRAIQEIDCEANVSFLKFAAFPAKGGTPASLTIGIKGDEGTAATITVTNMVPGNSAMRANNGIMEQSQQFIHQGTTAPSVTIA